jgi:MFS family permease
MQIPCGFLFDHFGRRRSVVGMLLLATLGGIIFTVAPTWPMLLTGRVLMGCDFGVMLIGSMVAISRWFPPDRFSTVTAMVMSIGLLGNLAATMPLAWAAQAIGWRAVFGAAVIPRLPPSPCGWWCATRRPATRFWPVPRNHHARCRKA